MNGGNHAELSFFMSYPKIKFLCTCYYSIFPDINYKKKGKSVKIKKKKFFCIVRKFAQEMFIKKYGHLWWYI